MKIVTAPSKNVCIHTCKSTYPDQFRVMLQGKCQIVERGGGGKAEAFHSGKIVLTLSHE